MKARVFGVRFCTYCGKKDMFYYMDGDQPIGACSCGNTDWCDNETEADVKKRFGPYLEKTPIKFINLT